MGRKILASIFFGSLIVSQNCLFAKRPRDTKNLTISRDFLGYLKLIFLFFVLYHSMLPGNFHHGSEIRHGIFWGINFGPVIFFFEAQAFFLGFDF